MPTDECYVIRFIDCDRCEGTGRLPAKPAHYGIKQVDCPSCQVYMGKRVEYVPLSAALSELDTDHPSHRQTRKYREDMAAVPEGGNGK